jgi:CubicO group peptidase (beta-lactamase class C family)
MDERKKSNESYAYHTKLRTIQEELPMTSSVLVVRHGYIVLEQYPLNDKAKLREVYSVTKSVLSALVGIAIKDGYLESIDQKIVDFFPEYISNDMNEKVSKVTIRHLLTMSDGIAKDEEDSNVSKDIFTGPLRNEPGESFFYNNLSPQILSMILTRATGLKAIDYGKKHLFELIGISDVEWSFNLDSRGMYSEGGYGLKVSTEDLAKIGYLYLNRGTWDRMQVLPREWVSSSTQRQIEVPESSWYFINAYGLLWWIRTINNRTSFTALGWAGQYIYVIPDLDIVVVITTLDAPNNEVSYLSIIDNFVVPAVTK